MILESVIRETNNLISMAREEIIELVDELRVNEHQGYWIAELTIGRVKEIVRGSTELEALKNALVIARMYNVGPGDYEFIDHPQHYGGKDSKHEAISVIEEWDLGFHLGNVVKYISRAGRKPDQDAIEDLKKAKWYLERFIEKNEKNT